MIALDTNILVYAFRVEMPLHTEAARLLTTLAEGESPWAIPWPCLYEFLRVVTHPRFFRPPATLEAALSALEALIESPSLVLLTEGRAHAGFLRRASLGGAVAGNLVFDAHIAALALEHKVTEILSHDRDMWRFPGLRARDPFAAI